MSRAFIELISSPISLELKGRDILLNSLYIRWNCGEFLLRKNTPPIVQYFEFKIAGYAVRCGTLEFFHSKMIYKHMTKGKAIV